MKVDLRLGEVTVDTELGVVTREQILDVVNSTCASAHCFKAKIKSETDVDPKDQ